MLNYCLFLLHIVESMYNIVQWEQHVVIMNIVSRMLHALRFDGMLSKCLNTLDEFRSAVIGGMRSQQKQLSQ